MNPPIVVVDAFTHRPYGGNPAAVCVLDAETDDAWMQAVAAEMNLSETAFLVPRDSGEWSLRWFTPRVEVSLCGHATLASAHALWTEFNASDDILRFHTRSGVLSAERAGNRIFLDFPATRRQQSILHQACLRRWGLIRAQCEKAGKICSWCWKMPSSFAR